MRVKLAGNVAGFLQIIVNMLVTHLQFTGLDLI